MAEDISPNRICEWRGAQANSCCSAFCSILLVHRRWPGFSPPTYSSFQKPRSQRSHLAFSWKYLAPRRPFNPSFELCQIKCKNDTVSRSKQHRQCEGISTHLIPRAAPNRATHIRAPLPALAADSRHANSGCSPRLIVPHDGRLAQLQASPVSTLRLRAAVECQ